MLIGAVFVAEILTPHVVVGAFALLPLLAALWQAWRLYFSAPLSQ
jgi:hypothetical protein